MRYRELRPLGMPQDIFDQVEARILQTLRKLIYEPIMVHLKGVKVDLQNARDPIRDALNRGTLTYNRGKFSGKFNAQISKALKELGARWSKRDSTFNLGLDEMPTELSISIRSTEKIFAEKIARIESELKGILPDAVADSVKVADYFDKTLFWVDKEFKKNAQGLVIPPSLDPEQRAKVAAEWENNLRISIKSFTQEETNRLRGMVKESFGAGNRYGDLAKSIQSSFDVTANKAKFWARQETKLLTVKYHETKFQAAGVNEYKWRSVTGTSAHPVRHRHHELSRMSDEGHVFRFDQPPVTTEPGEPERRNNPGEDYNCRCKAIPIVRF